MSRRLIWIYQFPKSSLRTQEINEQSVDIIVTKTIEYMKVGPTVKILQPRDYGKLFCGKESNDNLQQRFATISENNAEKRAHQEIVNLEKG